MNASKGPIKVFADLNQVKNALILEGFYDPTPLQVQKDGQIFGLAKRVNDSLEIHVRGFSDSTLESEIELSREYLEHLYESSEPHFGSLLAILRKHNIPFCLVRELPSDPMFISVPMRKTPWKPILLGLSILSAVGAALWVFSRQDESDG